MTSCIMGDNITSHFLYESAWHAPRQGASSRAMSSHADPLISPSPATSLRRPQAISRWLLIIAVMVFLMVVVGGITRLTESGLSMVRWEPISGIVPPLSDADWQAEFDAYKAYPEYQKINRGMSLDEFKNIYFWEYLHRVIGRLIGIVFALPLLWFAVRRAIPRGYGWRLIALLALGGLQGAIGWWMVASGLINRPDVSHYRLATHLCAALFILAGLFWTALDLRRWPSPPARLPGIALPLLAVLVLQILWGAFTAGLDAGYAFNSWPKMGETWFPEGVPLVEPLWRNAVDTPAVVQFVHRSFAYAVVATGLGTAWIGWRRGARVAAAHVAAFLLVQFLLGIATVVTGVSLWIAVAHQAGAALLLLAAVALAHRLGARV